MTELKSFLTGIYDALSEAEMAAIAHGQSRRAELRERGVLPRNMAVPVYHASNVEVTLDVGLTAEETEDGTRVFIDEASADNASSVTFSVELFELIEEQDLGDIDYDELLDIGTGIDLPPTNLTGTTSPTETERDEGATTDDETASEKEATTGRDSGATDVERDPSPSELADELTLSTDQSASSDADVEVIGGIGPTYGERLRIEGVETVADLTGLSAAEVADIVSTDSHTVSAERTASWLDTASALGERTGESGASTDGDDESAASDADETIGDQS
jgi:predicted flap endonuclease-1-like 5' DNA nuclease